MKTATIEDYNKISSENHPVFEKVFHILMDLSWYSEKYRAQYTPSVSVWSKNCNKIEFKPFLQDSGSYSAWVTTYDDEIDYSEKAAVSIKVRFSFDMEMKFVRHAKKILADIPECTVKVETFESFIENYAGSINYYLNVLNANIKAVALKSRPVQQSLSIDKSSQHLQSLFKETMFTSRKIKNRVSAMENFIKQWNLWNECCDEVPIDQHPRHSQSSRD